MVDEFQVISRAGATLTGRSDGKFNYGMREKANRNSPRTYIMPNLPDPVFSIQVDKIDGESHAKSVYGFARDNPEALAFRQPVPAKQTSRAFRAGACDFDVFGENCPARLIYKLDRLIFIHSSCRPRILDFVGVQHRIMLPG